MKFAVAAVIASNLLVTVVLFEIKFLIAEAMLDVVLAGVCLFFALRLTAKSARFIQAFSAYCGANTVLNLCAVALLSPAYAVQQAGQNDMVARFLEYLLLVWSIAVVAHILRHTFSISMPAGIILAVCYLLFYIQVAGLVLGI